MDGVVSNSGSLSESCDTSESERALGKITREALGAALRWSTNEWHETSTGPCSVFTVRRCFVNEAMKCLVSLSNGANALLALVYVDWFVLLMDISVDYGGWVGQQHEDETCLCGEQFFVHEESWLNFSEIRTCDTLWHLSVNKRSKTIREKEHKENDKKKQ